MKYWIARDRNGQLFVFYKIKPIRHHSFFSNSSPYWKMLPPDLFPQVTWENSPKKVELKIITKE